jgi:hypothetical protein
MSDLSGDPYEGARRAYSVLYPDRTTQDWEDWVTASNKSANGDFDNFGAFALLCREATRSGVAIEICIAEQIAFSAGYFEAMKMVVSSLLERLPIAGCIPHHQERYRRSQVNPDAQFE